MTNLDSMLKNRDITLPTRIHLVKAMVLPVVMYGCESWRTHIYLWWIHFDIWQNQYNIVNLKKIKKKKKERKLSTEELMLLNCGIGEDC